MDGSPPLYTRSESSFQGSPFVRSPISSSPKMLNLPALSKICMSKTHQTPVLTLPRVRCTLFSNPVMSMAASVPAMTCSYGSPLSHSLVRDPFLTGSPLLPIQDSVYSSCQQRPYDQSVVAEGRLEFWQYSVDLDTNLIIMAIEGFYSGLRHPLLATDQAWRLWDRSCLIVLLPLDEFYVVEFLPAPVASLCYTLDDCLGQAMNYQVIHSSQLQQKFECGYSSALEYLCMPQSKAEWLDSVQLPEAELPSDDTYEILDPILLDVDQDDYDMGLDASAELAYLHRDDCRYDFLALPSSYEPLDIIPRLTELSDQGDDEMIVLGFDNGDGFALTTPNESKETDAPRLMPGVKLKTE
ncbi:uncharacterized protein BJ171DRAFT_603784 [Polychytrium aggregatum]|uniref:uncharacterized protein n=1 Tax=Polychytrium aggregatum TaxID=110093 RepID=UPI0022FEA4FF|nr:uncharacterized protein BJ171DRAFT_603784 [Polychytrium aggregatum]KAI9193317.1 hypothetical protein BJ171DRAFT_603784 [Polychytrium aggregatum]